MNSSGLDSTRPCSSFALLFHLASLQIEHPNL
nr:MAG TPA: hypothetical protein [Caudoviricetes sp.]